MIDAYFERCTSKKKQCEKDNGPWLKTACSACPLKHVRGSAYIDYLFETHNLQLGGYPLKADALSLQTWSDLGILKQVLEARKPRLF